MTKPTQKLMPTTPDKKTPILRSTTPPARKKNIRTKHKTKNNWPKYFQKKAEVLLAILQINKAFSEEDKWETTAKRPVMTALRKGILSAWEQNEKIAVSKLFYLIKNFSQTKKDEIIDNLTEEEKIQYKLVMHEKFVGEEIFRFQINSGEIKIYNLDPDMKEKYKAHGRPRKPHSLSRTNGLQHPEAKRNLDFTMETKTSSDTENAPMKKSSSKRRRDTSGESNRIKRQLTMS